MAKKGIAEFFNEVKREGSKITWSSRKEVTATTIMVLIVVTIIALFFLAVDAVIFNVVQGILGL